MKLVVAEPETAALRAYLRREQRHRRVTSALARAEVIRATISDGAAVATARKVLAAVDQIAITNAILDDAATLAPDATARTTDAVHLASARLFGGDLRAFVTYDQRMATVAEQLLMPVAAPM